MKKSLILSLLAVVGAAGVFSLHGIRDVLAQGGEGPNALIDKLVQKFNLNKDEVTTVFDEFQAERQQERQQERQARVEERLAQAVTEGKISENQKSLILEKMKEWQNKEDNWRDLTPEERKTKMDEHRDEMEDWAEENGIDLHTIMGLGQGGLMKGYMKGYRAGFKANSE